ncbi:hypothetical protein Fmac_024745 [Flemingia macrophylla]|uniref:Uncharacterized protein n=1 Tax=Flemingia macrophylla TaxID=520843 RepID=A0ABD1LQ86_9FABA
MWQQQYPFSNSRRPSHSLHGAHPNIDIQKVSSGISLNVTASRELTEKQQSSNPFPYPDEEEIAFMRSLGWEESAGDDEGLTEDTKIVHLLCLLRSTSIKIREMWLEGAWPGRPPCYVTSYELYIGAHFWSFAIEELSMQSVLDLRHMVRLRVEYHEHPPLEVHGDSKVKEKRRPLKDANPDS